MTKAYRLPMRYIIGLFLLLLATGAEFMMYLVSGYMVLALLGMYSTGIIIGIAFGFGLRDKEVKYGSN